MLTKFQKAEKVRGGMEKLEAEYRTEGKPHTADRIWETAILLLAQPDVAAKLYDILRDEVAR